MTEEQLDFDSLARLAQSDPQAFEAKRLEMIAQMIESAPQELRQRLHRFQWRIDMERERSDNPLQACIRISNMMWNMIHADRGFLWSLRAMTEPDGMLALSETSATRAEVLTLKPPR